VLEDPDDDLPTLGYGLGEDIDQEQAICDAVDELCAEGPGDILVFLPGERDIRDTQQALADHLGPRALTDPKAPHRPDAIEIVPLFARLTAAEQHRVFEPHTLRRVVLATNVAETSLTVPGVRYVIDPGLARISRYSNRTKVQRLPIEPISRASANQRAGRSGRVADGVAIRLYSQRDYESRPEFTEPEILRTSLASVILQMAALGLGAVSDFPFLDPPEPRAVRDGIQLLVEIGALEPDDAATPPSSAGTDAATADHDRRGGRGTGARGRTPGPEQGGPHGEKGADFEPRTERTSSPEQSGLRRSGGHRLTAIGRDLATLPIDPRLGRMLIEGDANGCASEVLVIVAALSIQDVRERPLDHQQAADASHARFTDPTSDFITYLNLWRYLNVQSRDLSGSAFRRMCRGEFLHYLRFREWRDVVNQLRQMARPLDLDIHPIGEPTPAQVAHAAASGGIADAAARAVVAYTASSGTVDADEVHRALLVGLLSNLGNWDEAKRDYAGARGTHFTIWPGSGLARSHPAWVMTAELVETSRLFARTVARIRPEWIEPLAGPLLRHVYSEPYWSTSRGAAMVKEKVLLYGMTLVADRPVLLGRLDVTFGGGGARRSSVARPGTLAGMAQGLRARGRGEREVGESTALADALSEALATFGVQEADEGGGSAREGDTAASDTTTGPTAPAGASDSRCPGTTTAPSHDPTAEGAALVDDAHAQADPTGGAPEDEARSSRVAETGTGAETSTGPDSRAEPLADAEPVADAEPAGDPGITARELAREMFIRHALVLGEWREHHRFTDRNQELLDDAREAERRSRTHGLVADEEARFAFFDDLVPEGIVSARHFDQWWKHQRRETPDLLTYTPQMLLPRGTGTDAGDFPDHWEQGDLRLPLEYRFTPGSSRDGVTMTVPVEVLPRVSEDGTDWLVPGMLEDLCTETVRALPKAKRRLLAPAPEVGGKVAAWLRRALADGGPVPEGSTQGVAGAPGSPDTPDGPAGSDTRSASGARPGAADEGAPARTRTERTADGAIGTGTRGGTGEDPRSLDAALGRLAAWTRTSGQNATVDPSRLGKSRSGTTGSASRPATGADTVGRRRTPGSTDTTAPTGAATGAGADGTGSGAGETSGGAPSWAAHRPPFARAFARAISEVRGIDLSDSDLAHARAGLPEHLRMTFVVQDSSGRELGSGPSLVHLQRTLASQAEKAVRTAVRGAVAEAFAEAARRDGHSTRKGGAQGTGTDHSHHSGAAASAGTPPSSTGADFEAGTERTSRSEQSGLRGRNRADLGAGTERTSAEGEGVRGELHADDLVEFPEAPLPRSVESRGAGGMLLRGFPALVPQGDASEPRAGVRVMASPAEADRQHRLGLARLLLARVRLSPTRVTTRWTGREALMLAASPYGDTTSLVADAQLASALSLVDELSGEQGPATVRSRTSFDALATRARDLHEDRVHDILGHVVRAMGGLAEVQGLMRDHPEPSLREVVGEVEDQVRALVHPGFLADTPHWALPHLARYLRAGAVRIDKASRGARALSRDARDAQVVRDVSEEVDSARERAAGRPYEPVEAQRLERAWWLVQELRVSLFAQQLGTPQKVSAKRILGMVDR